tara:strand:+ start:39 stop:554 length:516 start_codon:yes stop_codon:yes gene_type:complete
MKQIKVSKLTLNIGAGKDTNRLEKGLVLLEKISGAKPVKTITQKRIQGWGLRPGVPVGCKVTLRKDKARKLFARLLYARDNKLNEDQIDTNGNLAFGIPEYIDIQDMEYIPEIGITGLEVCITLERSGFRIKRRKIMKRKIPKSHKIDKAEAIEFLKKEFNVQFEEKEDEL